MPIQFVIPEEPEDEFSDSDWQEVLDSMKPGGPSSLSHDRCEDILVGSIPANKVRAATRRILGFSYGYDAAPWHLARPDLPWRHPRFPWLWADGFAAQLVNPAGNPANDQNKPHIPAIHAGATPGRTGNYTRADCTIRFSRAPGNVLGDLDAEFDPAKEYARFLSLDALDPEYELLIAEGGDESSFYFAETSGTDGPAIGGPNVGTPFAGGVYTTKRKIRHTLLWRCVEEYYCCEGEPPLLKPTRLLRALGTLNSTPFIGTAGRKPGTLLLDGIIGRRYELPVRTNTVFGLFAWDWKLVFVEFDPKRGTVVDGVDPVAEGSRRYGHLLFPWRKTGGWFYATRGDATTGAGTYAGKPALESTDFHSIFAHVLNPDIP